HLVFFLSRSKKTNHIYRNEIKYKVLDLSLPFISILCTISILITYLRSSIAAQVSLESFDEKISAYT
ncbi:hypothetical protein, partial [Photobacterium sp. BZF1]|uniref:hypothetical protein n=1 Tax=Photobacterium sp. BZF1 TaxID=1904457 RepID=UPI001CA3A355